MPRLKLFSHIGIGLCSSGLVIMATPGYDLSIVAWIALVPLLFALRQRSVLSSFCLAWSVGSLAYAGIVYWVAISTVFTTLEAVLIPAYLGLHWGLFGAALTYVTARSQIPFVVAAPVLWVVSEYLRSNFFPLELPWTLLAHSQYQNTALIQMAAVTGVYGVSYLIVLVNSLIVEATVGVRHAAISAVVTLMVVGLVVVPGQAVLDGSSYTGSVPVTVVPGNIAQDIKWDEKHQEANFRRYLEGSRRAVEATATALVVWPETSVPLPLNYDRHSLALLQNLARETRASLLIGSGEREKFAEGGADKAKRYNSAVLVAPNTSEIRSYHKIQLLPFGEYLPLENHFPWPDRYRTHSSHYSAGEDYSTLTLSVGGEAIPFSVLICWEGIFPNLVRQFVQHGAAFLVGISNEAWFDGSSAPQFLAMNTFRAVENRRSLVRAVNGGISGFIDPYGRLVASMEPDHGDGTSGEFLTQSIPVVQTITFYTSHGDLFAQALMWMTFVFLLVPFRKRRFADPARVPGLVYTKELGKCRPFVLRPTTIRQGRIAGRDAAT